MSDIDYLGLLVGAALTVFLIGLLAGMEVPVPDPVPSPFPQPVQDALAALQQSYDNATSQAHEAARLDSVAAQARSDADAQDANSEQARQQSNASVAAMIALLNQTYGLPAPASSATSPAMTRTVKP